MSYYTCCVLIIWRYESLILVKTLAMYDINSSISYVPCGGPGGGYGWYGGLAAP